MKLNLNYIRVAALLASALLAVGVGRSQGAEIGIDAGIGVRLDRDHNVTLGLPAPVSAADPVVPVIRFGLPLSEYDQIEVAPGFTHTASRTQVYNSSYSLALGYLRGRIAGGDPSPYLRVGGCWRRNSADQPYSYSFEQFGASGGGGLKWRVGKVVGLRTEAVMMRWLTGGSAKGWDLVIHGGV